MCHEGDFFFNLFFYYFSPRCRVVLSPLHLVFFPPRRVTCVVPRRVAPACGCARPAWTVNELWHLKPWKTRHAGGRDRCSASRRSDCPGGFAGSPMTNLDGSPDRRAPPRFPPRALSRGLRRTRGGLRPSLSPLDVQTPTPRQPKVSPGGGLHPTTWDGDVRRWDVPVQIPPLLAPLLPRDCPCAGFRGTFTTSRPASLTPRASECFLGSPATTFSRCVRYPIHSQLTAATASSTVLILHPSSSGLCFRLDLSTSCLAGRGRTQRCGVAWGLFFVPISPISAPSRAVSRSPCPPRASARSPGNAAASRPHRAPVPHPISAGSRRGGGRR